MREGPFILYDDILTKALDISLIVHHMDLGGDLFIFYSLVSLRLPCQRQVKNLFDDFRDGLQWLSCGSMGMFLVLVIFFSSNYCIAYRPHRSLNI